MSAERHEDPAYAARPPTVEEIREQLPGIARLVASAGVHTAEWGFGAGLRMTRLLAEAAVDPERAGQVARELGQTAGVLGDVARSLADGVPLATALADGARALERQGRAGPAPTYQQVAPTRSLRERGEALLDRSRDVWNTDVAHPAYERILDELAPDEARILVLLVRHGPQPSVDVRTGGPVGMLSSHLVAPGLTMIGPRAGVRYLDRVPAYLNNLFRLGTVWFSSEPLRDPLAYQVVEAQPDVLAATHSVRFAKVVRRSIHLTPFGEDFCRTCLVDEEADRAPFPAHLTPPAGEAPDTPGE